MNKLKKMLGIGFSIAFISQIYINLLMNNFRVSLAVVFFPIFLIFYKELNIISTSAITASIVFLLRSIIFSLANLSLYKVFQIHYPVIFFYLVYGIIFQLFNLREEKKLYKIILGLWCSDFLSNLCEALLRTTTVIDNSLYGVINILVVVALFRSILVIGGFLLIKNYRILLIKEEHEERYRRLILLTSGLKSEIYFMNKNMDHIEEIMRNSFQLYEALCKEEEEDHLKKISLSIAKDIHEVKKDYIRVIRGIEEIVINKFECRKMSLEDIFYILKDSTMKFIHTQEKNIQVIFQRDGNFYTKEHYGLISILRNLINNAIEAIEDRKNQGIIIVKYFKDKSNHMFMVRDNGRGIKEKDVQYIFTPGFSTKFNEDTGDMNRGVGLAIVKDIVENRLKGKISVHSNLDKGTMFEIVIPEDVLKGEKDEILYSR